jgi:hypothetical protein
VPSARAVHDAGAATGASAGRELERRMPRYWFESRRRYLRKHRAALLLLALTTLGACAYTPPTQTNRLDIRQVPYTPDSGTIALR